MARSLRSLLMRRLLAPMLAVTVAGGGVSYFVALGFAEQTYDQWLLDTAWSLARQVEVDQGGVRVDLPAPARNLLVWDAQDKIYYRVDSQRDGLLTGQRALAPAALGEGETERFSDGRADGQPIRGVTVAVPDVRPRILVSVAETLHKRTRLAREILLAVILPQVVLILLAVLLIRSGVGRGLRPIAELEQAVHAHRPGELSPLPETGVPSELAPFTEAINSLLGRLGQAIDSQNRFIANAAHQIRTPLAALKVQVERALREADPEAHADSLRQALAALDRTTRLANQLLLLARTEAQPLPTGKLARLDLAEVVFEAGALWVPKALAQQVDLGFEGPDTALPVSGDAALLAEAVNNLIDNALRYGGKRITVAVRPGAAGGGPVLAVEDDGPGIPAAEREAVFERFYRLPGSRGSSSGLGLAIVREIAHLHHAEVGLERPDGGGVRVCLAFPLQ